MLRPGRFDKHLEFLPPDLDARKGIVVLNTKKWKNSHPTGDNLERLGQATAGFTGADLDMLCRNVFYIAFKRHVPNADLEIGLDNLQVRRRHFFFSNKIYSILTNSKLLELSRSN